MVYKRAVVLAKVDCKSFKHKCPEMYYTSAESCTMRKFE